MRQVSGQYLETCFLSACQAGSGGFPGCDPGGCNANTWPPGLLQKGQKVVDSWVSPSKSLVLSIGGKLGACEIPSAVG